MIIQYDNKKIGKKLGDLEKLLTDNGARFHPELALVCIEKSISLEMAGPCNHGEIIMEVPVELLLPAKFLNISVKGNKFVINPDKDQLTPEQIAIAELVFELYSLAGRVEFYKNESPWVAFREAPELIDEILLSRTKDYKIRSDFLHNEPDAMSIEEFVAYDFPMTRVLGIQQTDGNEVDEIFMPMIDYLNHDYQGVPYSTPGYTKDGPDNEFLRVINAQPFAAQRECYVSYGIYDAIDTFLGYGFVCETTPFVRSISLEIPVRDTAGIILNSFAMRAPEKVNEQLNDLRKFMPYLNKIESSGQLTVSHLIISLHPTPHATRRILRAIIRTLAGSEVSQKFVLDRVKETEKFILEKNIDFYNDLLKKVGSDKKTPEHLKQRIHRLAFTQLNKLYKYLYNDGFFVPADKMLKEEIEDQNVLK